MDMNATIEKLSNFKLWLIFFFYTFFVSVLVQFVLLPYVFPGLHAGYGILNSSFDSIGFHNSAVGLINEIRLHGWSAWKFKPLGQSPVGIASIFYYFILPDPRILIPISVALHASATLLLVNLMSLFVKNKAKAILCALPFLLFPSNLQWTAQWHRDGFSILGIILILQGMVLLTKLDTGKNKKWAFVKFSSIIYLVCGFILIWIGRTYVLILIEPFVKLFFSVLFLLFLIRMFKEKISWQRILPSLFSMLLVVFALGLMKTKISTTEFKGSALVSNDQEETAEYEQEEMSEPAVDVQPIAEKLSVVEKSSVGEEAQKETSIAAVSKTEGILKPAVDVQSVIKKSSVGEEVQKKTSVAAVSKTEARLAPVVPDPGFIGKSITQERWQKLNKSKTKKIEVKVKKPMRKYYIEKHWKRLSWLPLSIDNQARKLALSRMGFRLSSPEAMTNIDSNVGFGSVKDILIYLPRAVQIVFLAPFPGQWLGDASCTANSLMRKISILEMLVIYFALIFLPYAIWYWRKRIEIWVISIFCIYTMLIYGLAVCNIGTLYRMRYAYITTLVALGIAGFITLLEKIKIKREYWKNKCKQ